MKLLKLDSKSKRDLILQNFVLLYLTLEKAAEEFKQDGSPFPLCKCVKIIITRVHKEVLNVKLRIYGRKMNENFKSQLFFVAISYVIYYE